MAAQSPLHHSSNSEKKQRNTTDLIRGEVKNILIIDQKSSINQGKHRNNKTKQIDTDLGFV